MSDLLIPKINHSLWLTKQGDPREMKDNDNDNLLSKVNFLNKDSGQWQHILWTNCKACIPNTIASLSNSNIEIREIQEIKDQMLTYDIISAALNHKMGFAVDLARYEILKIMGGAYSDLNYILTESPSKFMEGYDFVIPYTTAIENNFMMSAKDHPILKTTISKLNEIKSYYVLRKPSITPTSDSSYEYYFKHIDDNVVFPSDSINQEAYNQLCIAVSNMANDFNILPIAKNEHEAYTVFYSYKEKPLFLSLEFKTCFWDYEKYPVIMDHLNNPFSYYFENHCYDYDDVLIPECVMPLIGHDANERSWDS